MLTDIRMPPTGTDEGIRAAKAIRAEHPDVGVVVLSQFADEEYAYDLLKDGAAGLGLPAEGTRGRRRRGRARAERGRAGRQRARPEGRRGAGGGEGPHGALPARVAHRPRARGAQPHGAGQNNAAIAKSLFLTERAVEKHINSLFHKLDLTEEPDVHRRVMAVLAFLRETDQA